MNKKLIGAVVVVIIIGAGAFYAGMSYAQGHPSAGGSARGSAAAGGFTGRTSTRGTGAGGGFTTGQVVSSGNGSITIQSAMSSSTEIVLVGDTTQISKSVSGSMGDLAPGTSVVVTGSTNSDGSLTAQSIQIRPAGAGSFGGGRPATTPGQ